MLGWEVSNGFAPYRELPVGARQQGSADRELIPEQTARNNSRAVRVHPLQCRTLLEVHEAGAQPQ